MALALAAPAAAYNATIDSKAAFEGSVALEGFGVGVGGGFFLFFLKYIGWWCWIFLNSCFFEEDLEWSRRSMSVVWLIFKSFRSFAAFPSWLRGFTHCLAQ